MKAKPADGDDYTYIYPQRTEVVQVAKAPPVVPYAEPTIAPNIAQPWPVAVEERLRTQDERIDALVTRLAAVEESLLTVLAIYGIGSGDDDDADF